MIAARRYRTMNGLRRNGRSTGVTAAGINKDTYFTPLYLIRRVNTTTFTKKEKQLVAMIGISSRINPYTAHSTRPDIKMSSIIIETSLASFF
jgi:hypothetical protein